MTFTSFLHIDRTRSQPIYRQIAEQIRVQIGEGRLPAGTQLPTVRHLADLLGVTRVTIQNAYGELQGDGWIESTVGRGTFVTAPARNDEMLTRLRERLTPDGMIDQLRYINKIAGLRSLAYAEPDPLLFPTDDFWHSFQSQAESLTELLQYGPAQGDELLRIEIAALLGDQSITAMPDDILITCGVTQAMALATRCLAPAGSCVVVEQPVYLGMLHVLAANEVQPVGVPLDDEGVRLDVLERVIQQCRPRFLYTVANFQNPTGVCTSMQRRHDLLALASRYNLPIVEDDCYGLLAYGDEHPLPLKALDHEEIVIHLSGFSKVLMPGLRIGYIVMPSRFRDRIASLRQAMDMTGTTIVERALANFLHRGRLKVHLRRILPHYRERRDTLLRALTEFMPTSVTWTKPEGGMCCWVTLPRQQGYDDLYHAALEHGVAFTPGDAFLIQPDENIHFRLCFGGQPPEIIREGIDILGQLLRSNHHAGAWRGPARGMPLV